MLIRTANQQFIIKQNGGYRKFVETECMARWGATVNWQVAGDPIRAWVTNSDWVVACDCCREQLVAEPGEPFFCPNCLNATNGGLARPVAWPTERLAIETLLLRRPNPHTRCYLPDETVGDLREQNDTMGWK